MTSCVRMAIVYLNLVNVTVYQIVLMAVTREIAAVRKHKMT